MNLASFFAGITCASFAASGVFFFKFWKASRDPFFVYFCVACWLLAAERVVALQFDPTLRTFPNGAPTFSFYLIRLVAFIVIFVGILQKNKKTSQTKRNPRSWTDN